MRVLVVEDDSDVREGLTDLLREYAFEVDAAAEGRAALTLAGDTPPDVILLDALMAGMGGAEFLDEQRRRPDLARVPVVVMTGLPPQLVGGLRAVTVLSKPFHAEDVLNAIRFAISHRNAASGFSEVAAG